MSKLFILIDVIPIVISYSYTTLKFSVPQVRFEVTKMSKLFILIDVIPDVISFSHTTLKFSVPQGRFEVTKMSKLFILIDVIPNVILSYYSEVFRTSRTCQYENV